MDQGTTSYSNSVQTQSHCSKIKKLTIGGGGAVALIVGDDLDTIVLPNSHAGVRGTQIDSYGFSVYGCHGCCLC